MELWEVNRCIIAHNQMEQARSREQLSMAWNTAAFAGAAVAGKLRPFSHYWKESQVTKAPQISREEFDRMAREAKEGMKNG